MTAEFEGKGLRCPLNPIKPYLSLDCWRAVAALWVVLFHIGTSYAAAHNLLGSDNPFWRLVLSGGDGVWIFFVISGYCITHAACRTVRTNSGIKPFLLARIKRIYPPYLFALVVSILTLAGAVILYHLHIIHHSATVTSGALDLRPVNLFANILLLNYLVPQSNHLLGTSWTLCYEVAFYFLTIGLTIAATTERSFLYRLHIFTIVCLVWLITRHGMVPYPFRLWPAFGLGALIYHVLRDNYNRMALATLIATAVLMLGLSRFAVGIHGFGGTTMLPLLLFAGALLALHRLDVQIVSWRPTQLLAIVGTFSYSIYLIHLPVISISTALIARLFPNRFLVPMFLVNVPLSIIAGRIFFQFFERPFLSSNAKRRVQAEETGATTQAAV